jgi:hypothetical protein
MVLLSLLVDGSSPHREPLARATLLARAQLEYGVVISGQPRSGKSSLGFQAAVGAAASGCRAAVLCVESVLAEKMPKPQRPLEDLHAEALNRIEFQYIQGAKDILHYCAACDEETAAGQAAKPMPSLIVVDDDSAADCTDRLALAKTLAALEHLCAWVRSRTAPGPADEIGPHNCFFIYVASGHNGPQSFPLSRINLHVVTVTVDNEGRAAASIIATNPLCPCADAPIAELFYRTHAADDGVLCIE